MLTALKGGIARVTGARDEENKYDPIEEKFCDHVLDSISHSLMTLINNDWVSDETVDLILQEMEENGMELSLTDKSKSDRNESSRNHYNNRRDSRDEDSFDRVPDRKKITYNSGGPPQLPNRRETSSVVKVSNTTPSALKLEPRVPVVGKSPAAMSSSSSTTRVVAIEDYDSSEPGDLAFKKGDIITVLKSVDENWYSGKFRGKEGIFPKSFVQDM
ncbi:ESCRT-0 subunit protein hse1 [Nowakowskiella sp. JEL0407]|nr:ESCRT-0 subunit protein hse1 [Nowakowskiella sp. JEL0407]